MKRKGGLSALGLASLIGLLSCATRPGIAPGGLPPSAGRGVVEDFSPGLVRGPGRSRGSRRPCRPRLRRRRPLCGPRQGRGDRRLSREGAGGRPPSLPRGPARGRRLKERRARVLYNALRGRARDPGLVSLRRTRMEALFPALPPRGRLRADQGRRPLEARLPRLHVRWPVRALREGHGSVLVRLLSPRRRKPRIRPHEGRPLRPKDEGLGGRGGPPREAPDPRPSGLWGRPRGQGSVRPQTAHEGRGALRVLRRPSSPGPPPSTIGSTTAPGPSGWTRSSGPSSGSSGTAFPAASPTIPPKVFPRGEPPATPLSSPTRPAAHGFSWSTTGRGRPPST